MKIPSRLGKTLQGIESSDLKTPKTPNSETWEISFAEQNQRNLKNLQAEIQDGFW